MSGEGQLNGLWADPVKFCFLKILDGAVVCNAKVVPVLTQFYPADLTPCITMSIQGGVGGDTRTVAGVKSPLDEEHDYYDSDNPDEGYLQSIKVLQPAKKVLSLHFWANTPEERDCIFHQAKERIREALLFNYHYCYNYVDGNCATTENTCDATVIDNRFSVQYKCPYSDISDPDDPLYRNPSTWFNFTGVQPESVMLRGEQYLEDTEMIPEIYRVVQDVDLILNVVQTIPVHPICTAELPDEGDDEEEFLE